MAKGSVINIRTDVTKQAIEGLYSQLGITVSDAVNIFFCKSLMESGLPFDMKLLCYNSETEAAMQEACDIVDGKFPTMPQTVDNFFKEMGL